MSDKNASQTDEHRYAVNDLKLSYCLKILPDIENTESI